MRNKNGLYLPSGVENVNLESINLGNNTLYGTDIYVNDSVNLKKINTGSGIDFTGASIGDCLNIERVSSKEALLLNYAQLGLLTIERSKFSGGLSTDGMRLRMFRGKEWKLLPLSERDIIGGGFGMYYSEINGDIELDGQDCMSIAFTCAKIHGDVAVTNTKTGSLSFRSTEISGDIYLTNTIIDNYLRILGRDVNLIEGYENVLPKSVSLSEENSYPKQFLEYLHDNYKQVSNINGDLDFHIPKDHKN